MFCPFIRLLYMITNDPCSFNGDPAMTKQCLMNLDNHVTLVKGRAMMELIRFRHNHMDNGFELPFCTFLKKHSMEYNAMIDFLKDAIRHDLQYCIYDCTPHYSIINNVNIVPDATEYMDWSLLSMPSAFFGVQSVQD